MWERTITVGSAGKTFSATGWKLGWGVGPPDLINALHVLHHNCIYTCPTLIQVFKHLNLKVLTFISILHVISFEFLKSMISEIFSSNLCSCTCMFKEWLYEYAVRTKNM